MALIPQPINRFKPPRGIVGTWANMEEDNARTGVAEVQFAAAVPLMKGTAEMEVAPLTTGNRFIGIALRTVDMYGTPTTDGAPTFQVGDIMGFADMGTVFVLAGAGVVEGATPFYDPATRKFHGASATGRLPLPTCEFDEAAADGEPVALRIRLLPGADPVTAVA